MQVNRFATGSMTFLFSAQKLAHSRLLMFFEGPWEKMNLRNASITHPLLMMPTTSTTSNVKGNNTLNSREPRIIPTSDNFLFHKPLEFPLTQDCLDEIQATEANDLDRSHPQRFQHPCILCIAVFVFDRTQRMSDTFQGIDDRAGKIVDGVHFVHCAGTRMRTWIPKVNDWISKSLGFIVDRDFGSNTVPSSLPIRYTQKRGGGDTSSECAFISLKRRTLS